MASVEAPANRWRLIYRTLEPGNRRQVVDLLLEADPGQSLSLPEAATALESRPDPESLRSNLPHGQPPMMAAQPFIEFESNPLCVARRPRCEEVASVLLAVDQYGRTPDHLVEGRPLHAKSSVNV